VATPYCSGRFRRTTAGATARSTNKSRNPTVLLRAFPTRRWTTSSTCFGARRNPTILLRAFPTMDDARVQTEGKSGRNPTVLLRAFPTGTILRRLSWNKWRMLSRNPTVLLRVFPTPSYSMFPLQQPPEVTIPPYCSGRFRRHPLQAADSTGVRDPFPVTSKNHRKSDLLSSPPRARRQAQISGKTGHGASLLPVCRNGETRLA
jgi:hypothetical protein